jgi:hypothetical protein
MEAPAIYAAMDALASRAAAWAERRDQQMAERRPAELHSPQPPASGARGTQAGAAAAAAVKQARELGHLGPPRNTRHGPFESRVFGDGAPRAL